MVPPLTLCAYMKKGPNLRWSLIQYSGGDEGDRTPDLLTASQALSQLSYAPVRNNTIRELGRRCKDNFVKLSPPRRGGAAAACLSDSSPVATGDLPPRNRPIYYVRLALPEHEFLDKNKPAGRRPAVFAKHRLRSRGRGQT